MMVSNMTNFYVSKFKNIEFLFFSSLTFYLSNETIIKVWLSWPPLFWERISFNLKERWNVLGQGGLSLVLTKFWNNFNLPNQSYICPKIFFLISVDFVLNVLQILSSDFGSKGQTISESIYEAIVSPKIRWLHKLILKLSDL